MSHPHQEILNVIDKSFMFAEKPDTGADRNHCDECTECYDYIIRLNPGDVSWEDIHDRWQFEGCGSEYRKYLFPGICRECLSEDTPDIEILFYYIDDIDELSIVQKKGIIALYQYLFDCGFALENKTLHRNLRDRLKRMKIEGIVF